MSIWFASKQPASRRGDARRSVEQAADQEDRALPLLAVELFHRSNIIHVMTGAGPPEVTLASEVRGDLKGVPTATGPL